MHHLRFSTGQVHMVPPAIRPLSGQEPGILGSIVSFIPPEKLPTNQKLFTWFAIIFLLNDIYLIAAGLVAGLLFQ